MRLLCFFWIINYKINIIFLSQQSGYIECEKDSCPAVDDCYVVKKIEGSCCDKCNGEIILAINFSSIKTELFLLTIDCVYKGSVRQSGEEWTDPEVSCSHFKCVAGIVTESTRECYAPCKHPLAALENQCCQSCYGEFFLFLSLLIFYSRRMLLLVRLNSIYW